MKTNVLVSISLIALLAATFGFAQSQSLNAKIPFQFTVEGKVLPAGQYVFIRSNDESTIRVEGASKGPSSVALVVTRLGSAIHTSPQDAHIVFDKVGDTYFLSEIWIPGLDGFLVYVTKGKHEHRTVDVPK